MLPFSHVAVSIHRLGSSGRIPVGVPHFHPLLFIHLGSRDVRLHVFVEESPTYNLLKNVCIFSKTTVTKFGYFSSSKIQTLYFDAILHACTKSG